MLRLSWWSGAVDAVALLLALGVDRRAQPRARGGRRRARHPRRPTRCRDRDARRHHFVEVQVREQLLGASEGDAPSSSSRRDTSGMLRLVAEFAVDRVAWGGGEGGGNSVVDGRAAAPGVVSWSQLDRATVSAWR